MKLNWLTNWANLHEMGGCDEGLAKHNPSEKLESGKSSEDSENKEDTKK